MAAFSLIERDHSQKVNRNATEEHQFSETILLICNRVAFIFGSKSYRSNDFLFHIFHSVKIFNSLTGEEAVQGFSEIF